MTTEPCLFCAIATGSVPATVIFEDEVSLAFLDHRPVFHGHVLLVPRTHVATLDELPDALAGPMLRNTSLFSRAVQTALAADGSFVATNTRVSQSVPHLHIHVIPRKRGDGLRGFFWPRTTYRDEAHMEETGQAIANAVTKLRGG